jgi:hypothetical protein
LSWSLRVHENKLSFVDGLASGRPLLAVPYDLFFPMVRFRGILGVFRGENFIAGGIATVCC